MEYALGIIAGCCTTAAAIPQLVKALRTRKVEGISPYMFMVLIVGLGMWTVYGILKEDWPIIVTNAVSCVLNATVLGLFYRYREN